ADHSTRELSLLGSGSVMPPDRMTSVPSESATSPVGEALQQPGTVSPGPGDLFPAPPPPRFSPPPATQTAPQGGSGADSTLSPPPPAQPGSAVPAAAHLATTNPGDPTYATGTQWGLNGAYGIRAPQAWDVSRGSTGVTVAVLDTGMDVN